MKANEAQDTVDRLYEELLEHWKKKIHYGSFMSRLREGSLPLPCIRRFFKDWSVFSVQVVALNAVSYYTMLPFFVRNFDLMPAFSDKVAEELVYPEPPGHTLILLKTAAALGFGREELFETPPSPGGRAISDFCRRIFFDGSLVDLWGLHVYEETLGYWSKEWAEALTEHYGLTSVEAVYFTTHAQADLHRHEGRMGHGPLNRLILQRILEQDETGSRLGVALNYFAFTMVDLHSLMEKNALENPYPDSNLRI